MKNLIAELLIKLAEKEQESKELLTQVKALEMVVQAMLFKMDEKQREDIVSGIKLRTENPDLTLSANNTPDDPPVMTAIERLICFSC